MNVSEYEIVICAVAFGVSAAWLVFLIRRIWVTDRMMKNANKADKQSDKEL